MHKQWEKIKKAAHNVRCFFDFFPSERSTVLSLSKGVQIRGAPSSKNYEPRTKNSE
jgi:hypothetical protein